jgi:hypothetical protein
MEEHLGILGPLIKAEVGQSIMVRLAAPACQNIYNTLKSISFGDHIFYDFLYVWISPFS